jgi:hypothetical protein
MDGPVAGPDITRQELRDRRSASTVVFSIRQVLQSAIVVGRGNLTHLPANLLHGCLRLLGSALPLVSMHEVSGRCRTRDAV